MQDAFVRDMFSISDVNNPRYNGHVQVSPLGKGAGGKRDRKGCTKGKIEAIMKNNIVRPKVCISNTIKKAVNSTSNHSLFANHHVVKTEQEEDPYTFTEPEPQVLSLYQPSGSSNKKAVPARPTPATMVCQEKSKVDHGSKNLVKLVKAASDGSSKLKKLEADIARSKVIGKRRKIVEQAPNRLNDWPSKREPGKVCILAKRKSTWQRERNSKHELLERIHQEKNSLHQYTRDLYPLGLELSDSESEGEELGYERSWFCRIGDGLARERRVNDMKASLRRQLRHAERALRLADQPSASMVSAIVDAARQFPASTAAIVDPSLPVINQLPVNRDAMFLLRGEKCSHPDGCQRQALPCTRHCFRHIMYNVDQRLFSHCTAKYPDNTQCTTPVFDVLHHLPLCHRHATSVSADSQNRSSESRSSKKVSKKSRMLGSSKRNNKKRKKLGAPPPLRLSPVPQVLVSSPLPQRVLEPILQPVQPEPTVSLLPPTQEPIVADGVVEGVPVEEVLAIASALDPEVQQRLLEEHELSTVLNQLSSDALNEILLDKNGEYEPTMEETEELERALEAVNNDVRSLETMSRSLPLLQLPLDTMALLDETSPFPAFHNGFPPTQTHQS